MIIAVDFDGCLASAGTWPEVGEPNEALINWLICLRKRGDKVILWTCRADEALHKAVEFCKVHGLEYKGFQDCNRYWRRWINLFTKLRKYCGRNGRHNYSGDLKGIIPCTGYGRNSHRRILDQQRR